MNKKATISLIRKYLKGELDARAMYELERQAQDDPVLMDMIQGVENSSLEVDEQNLMDISNMIRQRAEESKPDVGTAVPVPGNQRISWNVWIAAASVILISAIGILLWVERPADQRLIQDQQVVQDLKRPEVKPQNEVKTDTVPVISAVAPGIKTDLAVLSRKKINPVAAGKPGNPAENTVAAVTNSAPLQVLKDSSLLAAADIEQAKAKNSNDANSLKSDANSLKEVVIVGYGVQRKTMTTGSVSTIKWVAVENKGNADPLNGALMGKVAGLSIGSKDKSGIKVITGVVTDKITNEPVPGAAVLLQGERIGVTTDANGKFSLSVPSKTGTLLVSVIGYEQQEVRLNKKGDVHIAMSPDTQALSEVVVVGYGTAHTEKAHPVIGWPAYKKYLKENATAGDGKGGKVTITFSIDAEGRPGQIRIVKGTVITLNQKAISLIENGSRWTRGQDASAGEVTLKIKFH